jgi:hypothetical protein
MVVSTISDPPFAVVSREAFGQLVWPSGSHKPFSLSTYLESHLGKLKAKTIVVEFKYIDKDYLEDFAAYHVRCFGNYPQICKRLHFFACEFEQESFQSLLEISLEVQGSTLKRKDLKENYLGFIVVKPLPETCIGRTCLKVNSPDEAGKYFPTLRDYRANLFGISLNVKSLAFQEQDHVVSACATSALWSTFHSTGILFQHQIPSPVLITQSANRNFERQKRIFQSGGLSPSQMAQAIRNIGLDPIVIDNKSKLEGDDYLFRANLYAYLKCRIPVILGIQLERLEKNQNNASTSNQSDDQWQIVEIVGKHAVTATGFSLSNTEPEVRKKMRLKSERMNKIYVHDDQVGPFAEMSFESFKLSVYQEVDLSIVDNQGQTVSRLSTLWKKSENTIVVAKKGITIIPAYHKIRIPFETIYE